MPISGHDAPWPRPSNPIAAGERGAKHAAEHFTVLELFATRNFATPDERLWYLAGYVGELGRIIRQRARER